MKRLTEIDGEIWRTVPGFEDYQVSTLGRCRRGAIELEGKRDRLGYRMLGLVRKPGGPQEWFLTHRLIASVFLSPEIVQAGQFMTVNHKNRVRDDNRLENLELVTVADNNRHWRKLELHNLTAERQT